MDFAKLLPFPLPPAIEQMLAEYIPQLPSLVDSLTTVFERLPIYDNKMLFYGVLALILYVLVSMAMSTVRWVMNLFTFAIKLCLLTGVVIVIFWLTQGDNLDMVMQGKGPAFSANFPRTHAGDRGEFTRV